MNVSVPKQPSQIFSEIISTEDYFPNNNLIPLLIYKSVFNVNHLSSIGIINLLKQNSWTNTWINSIYDYHHYHSNTHEVLVIIAGFCNVIYGGPHGKIYKLVEGDVVIHPVGVSHKKESSSENFSCIGAYPDSIKYDMCYGKKEEHPSVDINIKKVIIPNTDPIFGKNGILHKYWHTTFS